MKIHDFIENECYDVRKWELPKNGAIYFICEEDGTIIYIGKTMNLQTRLATHSIKIEFYQKPVYFFVYPKDKCIELERILIKKIKPKHNTKNVLNITDSETQRQRDIDGASERRYDREKETLKIREKIVAIMEDKGINQSELAKLMGTSRQRVHQILKEEVAFYPQTIKKVEKLLDLIK